MGSINIAILQKKKKELHVKLNAEIKNNKYLITINVLKYTHIR